MSIDNGKIHHCMNRFSRHLLPSVLIALLSMTVCCCDDGRPGGREPLSGDTAYSAHAAMRVYATAPHRALQIVDSAEIVGNVAPFFPDTLCEDYAIILRDRAVAAEQDGDYREACSLWTRYALLTEYLNENKLSSDALEYAALYRFREQELKLEASEADSERKSIIIAACALLIVVGAAGSVYFYWQRREMKKKNAILAQQISEALNYKEKYLKLARNGKSAPGPTSKENGGDAAPPMPSADGDSGALFSYLQKDILEQELFLDPYFDRQAVADRYGLSHLQVGAAFAQGSREYSSVSDFIRACRLEYACRLLTTTEMRIAEVASASGFTRVTTFNHDFKARYKLSPTEFRGVHGA